MWEGLRRYLPFARLRLDPSLSADMRRDWDKMAIANARHYIANYKTDWGDKEFLASGRETFDQYIASDLDNVCRSKPPQTMRVLEIGCGTGRVTRALGEFFGEVHGVDVSAEMILRARQELAGFPNVHFHLNNGVDLAPVRDLRFDFAFSCCVFHHIPDVRVIQSYWREVAKVLRRGALSNSKYRATAVLPPDARDRGTAHPSPSWRPRAWLSGQG